MPDEIESWADAIESAIAGSRHFDRVRVLRATASTQDAARDAAGGRPGLILTTGQQTAGRGRLGRAWHQAASQGIATTFVLRAGESRPLSIAAGLAALDACRAAGASALRLKDPNDVILPAPDSFGGFRKVAGVLIEQAHALALVGIGINVAQSHADFPPDIASRATSLRLLGVDRTRLELLLLLVRALDARLGQALERLEADWRGALWRPTSA